MNISKVTFLGTRGTIPVDGPQFMKYGGATSCALLQMGGECIVLDGGSGLSNLHTLLNFDCKRIHILLSHPHMDHMIGIPTCASFFSSKVHTTLYAASVQGLGSHDLLKRLMSAPLWPVGPSIFPTMDYVDLKEDFYIGSVHVSMIAGPHPGGCTVFRFDCDGESVVYATDIELDDQSFTSLSAFAQGCSLLLVDGQYTDAELPAKTSFGHSSWQQALRLAQQCEADRMGIIHHDPSRTDNDLDGLQDELQSHFPNGFFARRGEVITL